MPLFIYLFIYFVATIPYNMAEAKGAILGTESMKDGDEVGKRQTYEYNATLVKIKAHNKIIHKVHTYHSSSIAALVELYDALPLHFLQATGSVCLLREGDASRSHLDWAVVTCVNLVLHQLCFSKVFRSGRENMLVFEEKLSH